MKHLITIISILIIIYQLSKIQNYVRLHKTQVKTKQWQYLAKAKLDKGMNAYAELDSCQRYLDSGYFYLDKVSYPF